MSYIGNQPTNVAFVTDTFSGNGSTTAFTMSVAPASTTSVLVAITGVLQDPSTYSVSGTALTFSAAPPSGTGNISVRYLGIPASGVTTTAYRTVTDFTATAGQTTFTPPSYTVGYIDVYRNGSKLGTADFTATNGTTVVLAAACNAGDLVETVSMYVSSVLNAIPQTGGTFSGAVGLNAGVTNDVAATTGIYAKGAFAGTVAYTDGIVMDYTTGTGRITVGASDGITFYNGGPSARSALGAIPVGSSGTVMVSGNMPAFSAYLPTNQTVSSGTPTKITLSTEEFDTASCYDNSTNYRFTPNVAGYYQVEFCVGGNSSSVALVASIYKNGSSWKQAIWAAPSTTGVSISIPVVALMYMNGSTDYIEFYGQTNGGTVIQSGQNYTYAMATLVRAA